MVLQHSSRKVVRYYAVARQLWGQNGRAGVQQVGVPDKDIAFFSQKSRPAHACCCISSSILLS
jgi:hypothetical protein